MSRWEDLLNEPTPAPGVPESPGFPKLILDDPIPPPVVVPTWRLDGHPPPENIVRLAPVRPASGFVRNDDAYMELARVPRGPRGEDRGWWWLPQGVVPPEPVGWAWDAGRTMSRRGYDFRQVWPLIDNVNGEFAHSLVLALPYDEEWYQVGITQTGVPVWAWIGGHDDFDIQASDIIPD